MKSRGLGLLGGILLGLLWLGHVAPAPAQYHPNNYQLQRWWYYPYYYFPHNYWPTMGPRYPEKQDEPYRPPPAYMAYPAFQEPNWRYNLWEPMPYYRGFHFWLDQF